MSSFSSIAELPLAAAVTSLDANAYMIGATAASSAGTLDYDAKAKITFTSAAAVIIADPFSDVDAKATVNVSDTFANTALNTIDYNLSAGASVLGVSTSSTLNTTSHTLTAKPVTPSTIGTFVASALNYDADAKITLNASTVSANIDVNAFHDVDAQASANLNGATSVTAINSVDYDAKANKVITGILNTTSAGSLEDYTLTANIVIAQASASADLVINALEDEDAQGVATVTGVSATSTANWDTVNGIYAVQVIFLNTDFERSRTVNIVPYGNYTVYVTR